MAVVILLPLKSSDFEGDKCHFFFHVNLLSGFCDADCVFLIQPYHQLTLPNNWEGGPSGVVLFLHEYLFNSTGISVLS
jgi:hypothetical protein